MRDIRLGKHQLKIYDSIDDLPIVRHHKFSKLLLVDAHIGSSIQDFDNHIEKILRYISGNKPELAQKELMNLRQNVYFIQEGVSPKHLAFSVLIHSIDGEEITEISDDTINKVAQRISDCSFREVDELIEGIKKKLESELKTYFPELFDSALVKEYYDKLKHRTLLMIEKLEKKSFDDNKSRELSALTDELVLFTEPQTFWGEESLEVQCDKQFENTCLAISQHINANPKKFSTLEYYNALFYMKEQAKKQKKTSNRKLK